MGDGHQRTWWVSDAKTDHIIEKRVVKWILEFRQIQELRHASNLWGENFITEDEVGRTRNPARYELAILTDMLDVCGLHRRLQLDAS